MSETIVVKTDVAASNRTLVRPDGTKVTIEFQAVAVHERDALVRVFAVSDTVMVRVGSGRHSGTGDSAVLTFTSFTDGKQIGGGDLAFANTFGDALTEISPTLFDLILKV